VESSGRFRCVRCSIVPTGAATFLCRFWCTHRRGRYGDCRREATEEGSISIGPHIVTQSPSVNEDINPYSPKGIKFNACQLIHQPLVRLIKVRSPVVTLVPYQKLMDSDFLSLSLDRTDTTTRLVCRTNRVQVRMCSARIGIMSAKLPPRRSSRNIVTGVHLQLDSCLPISGLLVRIVLCNNVLTKLDYY
jgi:hypothetical protein